MLKQAHSGLGLLKHWQQRHFLLDCGVLAYFDSAAALAAHCDGQAAVGGKGLLSKGKEGIPLRGHEVLLREGRSVISLVKDGKQVLQLDVKADAERRDWVAALKEHALFLSVQQ